MLSPLTGAAIILVVTVNRGGVAAAGDLLSDCAGLQRSVGSRVNIKMADAAKPSNAHIALNVVSDADGNELQILRDNMPFGSIARPESGTYYIGYAKTARVIEKLLKNMFIGDSPGNHDRILDFSTAVTGTLFFTPTRDFLDAPPDPPASADRGRRLAAIVLRATRSRCQAVNGR